MIETFVALLFAHAIADFLLQTRQMVARKREPQVLLAHTAIVAATAWAAVGFALHPAIAVLALLHLAIDALKLWALGDRLGGYLGDQALHLATIAGVATWVPGLYAFGAWGTPPPDLSIIAPALAVLPEAMAYAAGAIIAAVAGGYAVGKLLDPFLKAEPSLTKDSLKDAGRIIGLVERSLAFFLVVVGQAAGVGLLLAAKSVLRFSTAKDDRKISEYVIVGTLASIGWALVTGFATLNLVALVP